MIAGEVAQMGSTSRFSHELRFTSMYHPGRGVVVPCDEAGHVDLDSLTERLRNAYLGARAMVGREYLYPTVELTH
jgi:hypothetical protein